jgi:DNA modification methylase
VRITDLTVEHLSLDAIKPYPRNARTHSKKQVKQIAASIQEFGFCNPVLISDENEIVAGHGRVAAAKLLGLASVPCLRLSHLTPEQRRAYVIADNQLAAKAGWDKEILAKELQGLMNLEFNIELTGFSLGEVDLIIGEADKLAGNGPEDQQPQLSNAVVSRPGDLWILGDHVLICGDARDGATYRELMLEERADLVFTDPPYNVRINGHVGGNGSIQHEEFAFASGEMSEAEFIGFLVAFLNETKAVCRDGAILYVCMDWRHDFELQTAFRQVGLEFKNLCTWVKDNGGQGSFYRSQHELVFVLKHGEAPHLNTFELGQHGRYRTNVWEYPGVNTLRKGRLDELSMHPTVKPVALVADAIRDCSKRGDLVLDPFSGSGTTIIAAEVTGRRAHAIEYEGKYVDVAVRRWQTFTGKHAILAETRQTFEALEEERLSTTASAHFAAREAN